MHSIVQKWLEDALAEGVKTGVEKPCQQELDIVQEKLERSKEEHKIDAMFRDYYKNQMQFYRTRVNNLTNMLKELIVEIDNTRVKNEQDPDIDAFYMPKLSVQIQDWWNSHKH